MNLFHIALVQTTVVGLCYAIGLRDANWPSFLLGGYTVLFVVWINGYKR